MRAGRPCPDCDGSVLPILVVLDRREHGRAGEVVQAIPTCLQCGREHDRNPSAGATDGPMRNPSESSDRMYRFPAKTTVWSELDSSPESADAGEWYGQ